MGGEDRRLIAKARETANYTLRDNATLDDPVWIEIAKSENALAELCLTLSGRLEIGLKRVKETKAENERLRNKLLEVQGWVEGAVGDLQLGTSCVEQAVEALEGYPDKARDQEGN